MRQANDNILSPNLLSPATKKFIINSYASSLTNYMTHLLAYFKRKQFRIILQTHLKLPIGTAP